jgi:predicted kinase
MAVTRWSAQALAEMRGVEHGLPATSSAVIKTLARKIAADAGREQVESDDVRQALGRHFGVGDDELEENP